jgi:hypothetical protein
LIVRLINHYPGGQPVPKRPKPDVDTVIGIIAAALLCFGIWLVCTTPEIVLAPSFSSR